MMASDGNLNGRRGVWVAQALLAVVVWVWFSPWWVGGQFLAPLDLLNEGMEPWRQGNESAEFRNHIVSDAVTQYLVYRKVAERGLREEGRVGWSDLTYGGTAEYANTMALYDDWTVQLHRWFDFGTAWHLGIALQVWLAGAGMLLFLRGRGILVWWALCGALLFAANSQFVVWVYHRWALGAFCWVPWILWAADGWRRDGKWGGAPVAVFLALAFLGGTLQHAALVALVVMAHWLEGAWERRRDSWRNQGALLGRYALWGGLGVGMAAFMFLPCVDALATSNRLGLHTGLHGNAEAGVYPGGPWQPLFHLAAYPLMVFPSLLGGSDSLDLLKLFKSDLFYVVYFGALPVLAGLWLLVCRRQGVPVLARVLVAAGLLLPLTPLVRVLYQRLFLLFVLGGILGFVWLVQSAPPEWRRRAAMGLGWAVGVGCVVWLAGSVAFVVAGDGVRERVEQAVLAGGGSSFGYFTDWMRLRGERFVEGMLIWSPKQLVPLGLLGAGLAGLWLGAAGKAGWRPVGGVMLGSAVVLEVMFFAARWVVWSDPERHPLYAVTPEIAALQEEVGRDGRVTTLIHQRAHLPNTPMVPNITAVFGIAVIGGYDSVVPDGMILPGEDTANAERLGRLGVTHLVTYGGNESVPQEWEKVAGGGAMDVYRNPLAVPRYAGWSEPVMADDFLAGGAVARMVKLEEESGLMNRRQVVVPAGVSVVRVAENYGAGWRFRMDGENGWTEVARAADASMRMDLPHSEGGRLEMEYRPPLRQVGWMVSAVAVLGTGGLFLMGKRGEKDEG